jgi:hypothetical protein
MFKKEKHLNNCYAIEKKLRGCGVVWSIMWRCQPALLEKDLAENPSGNSMQKRCDLGSNPSIRTLFLSKINDD